MVSQLMLDSAMSMTKHQKIAQYQNESTFTIKDNILWGKEITIPGKSMNFGDIILEIFDSNPDLIGQIDAATGKPYTYSEMKERSIRCAIWLKKQGIKTGDVVAVCTSSHFDSFVPFFACLYIGAICAPEYHKLPKREFYNFFTTTTPKAIFLHNYSVKTLTNVLEELNIEIPRIVFENEESDEVSLEHILSIQSLAEVDNFRTTNITNLEEPALLLGTSGTTGEPKLAIFSHLSLRAMSHPSYTVGMFNRVCISTCSLRWIPYINDMIQALRANSTRIIVQDYYSAKYYYEIIKKYKVEHCMADSNLIRETYKLGLIKEFRSTNLKTITFGGSTFKRQIHEDIIKLLPEVEVLQIYGSTEIGNTIVRQTRDCQSGSCGYVRPGVKIRVVNIETGKTLGPNEEGELRVKAPTLACSYWKNPEAFNKNCDPEGWWCTGDIGYYDENGEIYISGRFSQFIKYRDCRLSDTYMEHILDEHLAVYKAAVVGIPADVEGEIPIAAVIKEPGKEVTENELINYFTSNVSGYYRLYGVKFIDKFPRTVSGKINKKQLKQMIINNVL
ncbi:luciferin 4-monooxygenase-like [Calliopsis andreniformis]|uniref:luciferin 4-monooxygenase-like n=1 Tax=Calliopsis andreniformis TaxID=337506 RepID=UPI003FCD89B8